MSKRKTPVMQSFGERLAQLRKTAGYTQVEFAAELAITQRMVAYYEAPDAQAPAHLLPQMAQVLGVSVDVLLGVSEQRSPKRIATNRLERRLLEIDKLDGKAKRQITQLLDSFIEGEKLKAKARSQTATQPTTRTTTTHPPTRARRSPTQEVRT
jgi:transcriptional regulator with XRE-family HTH domain